jgi:hypothetical protein
MAKFAANLRRRFAFEGIAVGKTEHVVATAFVNRMVLNCELPPKVAMATSSQLKGRACLSLSFITLVVLGVFRRLVRFV